MKPSAKQQIKEQIKELSKELQEYNYAYYVLNQSLTSDFDFDKKLKQLQDLEEHYPEFASENSPTKRVGGSISKRFESRTHLYPMLSLSNTYSKEDLEDFDERVKKLTGKSAIEYVCELKYDGAAVSLLYQNGEFVSATTRGDGTKGDVISENIKTIASVPLTLRGFQFPETFEIRGEVIMPLDEFEKLNIERTNQGLDAFANPRNTAAGTLKLQDSSETAARTLDCFLYSLHSEEELSETHADNLKLCQNAGFKIPNTFEICPSMEAVWAYIQKWKSKKQELNFEIDGIVVKVNALADQKILGSTSKSPRWAMAYKYPAERQLTQIKSIDYQVGRTGKITPVANLKPVHIGGTVVKRASLHNAQIIEQLDLHEQDWVWIEKGGEIIPKIISVAKEKRTSGSKAFRHIDYCPECQDVLIQKEGEANHYCVNSEHCAPQILARLEHFVSRKAMNIEHLGTERIRMLIESKLLKTPVDLYYLETKKEQLVGLSKYVSGDGLELENRKKISLQEKSVHNILTSIEASKQQAFEKLIFALGIRHVGERTAKLLAKQFKNFENLSQTNLETLMNIDDIGEISAKTIFDWIRNETNIKLMKEFQHLGLRLEIEELKEISNTNHPFYQKKMIVSGVFHQFSRTEIKAKIESLGGISVSSISKSTDFVVAGEKMGPSKRTKAETLGIQILTEDEFIALLGPNSKSEY
ncbi:MAG: NAD-dependent DNA ligase LigA [Flavobacteriales bacterium]